MFDLKHVSKSYDDNLILDGVDLSVGVGEVVALIGENGVGKTTLLDIINGKIEPDAGQVNTGGVIGFVAQELNPALKIRSVFGDYLEEWRLVVALDRVGLNGCNIDSNVSELSGGQKTRLSIAAVLARDPSPTILLLDEPTNNLDRDGLLWLGEFIESFSGAILIVSHDRDFINRTATKVAELDSGKLRLYGGNYDVYKKQKESERRTEIQEYEQKIAKKQQLQEVFRHAQNRAKHGVTKTAKDNEKMMRHAKNESVQMTFARQTRALKTKLARFDNIKAPGAEKTYSVNLAGSVAEGKLIIKFDSVTFGYGGNDVVNNISFELRGSQRLRLTGRNGSGKSTILKLVTGKLNPKSGQVTMGSGVSIGYFSQDIDGLDLGSNMIDNLPNHDLTSVYNLANIMGIKHDDIKKSIYKLSRGQLAKLGITKLLASEYQLLVLDEPTNHLDIKSREYIEKALQKYNGAILCASHDEYFISQLGVTGTYNLD